MSRVHRKSSTAWDIFVALAFGAVMGLLTLLASEVFGSAAEDPSVARLVPAGVCGLLAFCVAAWRTLRVASLHDVFPSLRDGWSEGDL